MLFIKFLLLYLIKSPSSGFSELEIHSLNHRQLPDNHLKFLNEVYNLKDCSRYLHSNLNLIDKAGKLKRGKREKREEREKHTRMSWIRSLFLIRAKSRCSNHIGRVMISSARSPDMYYNDRRCPKP